MNVSLKSLLKLMSLERCGQQVLKRSISHVQRGNQIAKVLASLEKNEMNGHKRHSFRSAFAISIGIINCWIQSPT